MKSEFLDGLPEEFLTWLGVSLLSFLGALLLRFWRSVRRFLAVARVLTELPDRVDVLDARSRQAFQLAWLLADTSGKSVAVFHWSSESGNMKVSELYGEWVGMEPDAHKYVGLIRSDEEGKRYLAAFDAFVESTDEEFHWPSVDIMATQDDVFFPVSVSAAATRLGGVVEVIGVMTRLE